MSELGLSGEGVQVDEATGDRGMNQQAMESRYWPDNWRWSYIVLFFKACDEEVVVIIGG